MKPDSRRVYVFIVAGLIAAVVVGVAVWRMSSPSANYSNAADQSATTSVSPTHTAAEETTTSSTDHSPRRSTPRTLRVLPPPPVMPSTSNRTTTIRFSP